MLMLASLKAVVVNSSAVCVDGSPELPAFCVAVVVVALKVYELFVPLISCDENSSINRDR